METGIIIAIIALVISILSLVAFIGGWRVEHRLAIRANEKSFRDKVLNDARLEITKAIRDYQNWLNEIYIEVTTLHSRISDYEENNVLVDWISTSNRFRKLLEGNHSLRWVFCLEEYEILFPETTNLRKELSGRHSKMMEYLNSLSVELISIPPSSTSLERKKGKRVVEEAQKKRELIVDQLALMEDLRIYLQNFCLGHITGNKIPERQPTDPSVPRIVQDERGNLRIVPGKDSNAKK